MQSTPPKLHVLCAWLPCVFVFVPQPRHYSVQVFLQRSAVNLLGVVLDVPEFFWSAPDHLQVCVYYQVKHAFSCA